MLSSISEKILDIWLKPNKYTLLENSSQEKLYNALYHAILRGLNDRRCILVLYGKFGVGKTFLARKLLKSLENEHKILDKIKYYDIHEIIFQNREISEKNFNDTYMIEKVIRDFLNKSEHNIQIIILDSLESLPADIDYINLGSNFASNGRVLFWIFPMLESFSKHLDNFRKNKKFYLEQPTHRELEHFKNYFYEDKIEFSPNSTYHDVLKLVEGILDEN